MTSATISDLLNGTDPLCDDLIDLVLSYQEEDLLVDFKEDFDSKDEKQWHGITKDIAAFANTHGGYIVFGVKDSTYELTGIDQKTADTISNTNLVLQKINRHILPAFTDIRTKRFLSLDKLFVIIFIPASKGKTHIVSTEAKVKYSGGKQVTIMRPGEIYIRRSGGNKIIDCDSMEDLIHRRINYYKLNLFEKISRVIEAPPEQEVIIVSPEYTGDDITAMMISDSPDAIPVKGRMLPLTPQNHEQEIDTWIAANSRDKEFLPNEQRLWLLYSLRENLDLSVLAIEHMAKWSLRLRVPSFYWIKDLDNIKILEILKSVATTKISIDSKSYILKISAFIGKGAHSKILNKIGSSKTKIGRASKFPSNDPFDNFSKNLIDVYRNTEKFLTERNFVQFLTKELNAKVESVLNGQVGAVERSDILSLDCYIYMRTNKYRK
jgi:hypothetical protein